MYEQIENYYSQSSPEILADALMDGPAYVIHWLYRLIGSDLRIPEEAARLPGWQTLADLLVELAKLQPSVAIAQTLPFVTKINETRLPPSIENPLGDPGKTVRRAEFDEQISEVFFKNLDILLSVYRDAPDSVADELQSRHGDEIRDRWISARGYAHKHASNSTKSQDNDSQNLPDSTDDNLS